MAVGGGEDAGVDFWESVSRPVADEAGIMGIESDLYEDETEALKGRGREVISSGEAAFFGKTRHERQE
jgi:hypothetical protein